MRCPHCGQIDTQVRDSRPAEDHTAIRRRRVCPHCSERFTTFERVQLREIVIAKRSGALVPFDRDKLTRSIKMALRKRPIELEQIERMVSTIVRTLENSNEAEIASTTVGQLVMDGLKAIDGVAYVRYASVYRDFRDAKDFQRVLKELSQPPAQNKADTKP
jgi:transcriptional repressor NrdR